MTVTVTRVLADAWALWRNSRDLLVRVAAPFLFLPDYALKLLAAPPPLSREAQADLMVAVQQRAQFIGDHLPAFLIAAALVQLGVASLTALLLDQTAEDVRGVLKRGVLLWPRFMLAALLVGVPASIGTLLLIPGLLIAGRAIATGPTLAGERPVGALGAVLRSVALTRGHTLTVSALAGVAVAVRLLAPWPFDSLDVWLRALHSANPVALAVIDAAAAGADMLAEVAAVLIGIAAYRALRESKGI